MAAAEAWLLAQGWPRVRVRSQGETARIELPAEQLPGALLQWAETPQREALVQAFIGLGFSAVGLDLEGLISGKLNRDLRPKAAPTPHTGP